MENNIIVFKGIKFYNYNFYKLFSKINKGGYLVAPAASAITNIDNNKKYYDSLKKSDVAILDSGFFCMLLRLFWGKKVTKFSGYLFLKSFLNLNLIKKKKLLTIDPTSDDSKKNVSYLKYKNFINVKSYVAPKYNIENNWDNKLLKLIKKNKPRYILINIGGGVQELLALYIKKNVNLKISIFCTGAAIAFLTKKDAPINDLVDKLYLGWLLRTLYNPRRFFIRTVKSLILIKQFVKK